jgi:hypothetical protein
MPIDPEYLREHYASLSTKALLAIDRAGLVEMAQKCYDDELGQRQLPKQQNARISDVPNILPDEDVDFVVEALDEGDKPGWLEEAAEVCSWSDVPNDGAYDAEIARDALEGAGIPCYLDLVMDPQVASELTHRWRLRVPGNFNLQATSVLELEIFNPKFDAEWKTHLEGLSDKELRETSLQVAFGGLIDRIERVTKAYDEEIARRRLKAAVVALPE